MAKNEINDRMISRAITDFRNDNITEVFTANIAKVTIEKITAIAKVINLDQ
jgi:hypothetical protein